jgi:prepilin-type N-terminal cleavage/methylation domain-containing protein
MKSGPHIAKPSRALGFTLVEMLLALTLMSMLITRNRSRAGDTGREQPDPDGAPVCQETAEPDDSTGFHGK